MLSLHLSLHCKKRSRMNRVVRLSLWDGWTATTHLNTLVADWVHTSVVPLSVTRHNKVAAPTLCCTRLARATSTALLHRLICTMALDSAPIKNSAEVNNKIVQDSNPEPDQHNLGQPIRSSLDSEGKQRSKFATDCSIQHRASLECIEDNYVNRDVCQPFFDAYITCRRDERERRLAKNTSRGFWG